MHQAAVSIWLAAIGAVPPLCKFVVDVLQHRQTKREWKAREEQRKKDEQERETKRRESSHKERDGNDEQEREEKAEQEQEGEAEQEREKQERGHQDEIDRQWLARVGHFPSSSRSNLLDGTRAKEEGNAYFRDGNFEEAIKCYSKSIDELRTAVAYVNRATAYFKLNKFTDSEKDCTEALKIDDRYFKAYARRAMARAKLVRNLRGALRDVKVALELEPNSQDMKDLLSELNLVLG